MNERRIGRAEDGGKTGELLGTTSAALWRREHMVGSVGSAWVSWVGGRGEREQVQIEFKLAGRPKSAYNKIDCFDAITQYRDIFTIPPDKCT